MIFSIVFLNVCSSSRTCLTRRLARELNPEKELAWVRASSNLIPPSSAKSAASLNVLVSLKHSLKMALRASGSTGTAISPTAALRRASDWSELSPEHSNLTDPSKTKYSVNYKKRSLIVWKMA